MQTLSKLYSQALGVAEIYVDILPIMLFFFFFLISNGKYILKKNTVPYIGNVLDRQKRQETKLQWLNKIGREKQDKEGKTKHHSRRVKKKKDLNSRMDRSWPSKLLAFCSRQIHHIKQCGTILHITILRWRLKLHDRHSNKSTTLCGITQQIPNKQKTILRISKAKGHWRRRQSTDSPHLLHIKHHSRTTKCLFWRLSIVRILPKAAVQEKKATRGEPSIVTSFSTGKKWR